MKSNTKQNKKVILISIIVALIALIGACTWYLNDYYRADTDAIAAFAQEYVHVERDYLPDIEVSRTQLDD